MFTYNELKIKYKNNADRFCYIDFMLRFTGSIRRSDLGNQYTLSNAAASKILAEYNKVRPNNMRYDHSIRANVLKKDYEPLIEWKSDVALGMLANGFNKNKLSEQDNAVIPYEKITSLPEQIKIDTVSAITRAISNGYSFFCDYYSKSGNGRSRRELIPLEILHDGENWLFRAYDRSETDSNRNPFKFFNFSRVLKIDEASENIGSKKKKHEHIELDQDWNIEIPLDLKLHEDRDKKEQEEIRIDFGLSSGTDQLFILKRAAFLWILKNKWHIDTRTSEQIKEDNEHLKKANMINRKKYYKFRLCNLDMIKILLENNNCHVRL